LRAKARRLGGWAREQYALALPRTPKPVRQEWDRGIGDEIEFWRTVLERKGEPWPVWFRFATDPASPLQPLVTGAIDAPPAARSFGSWMSARAPCRGSERCGKVARWRS
jgi:hypothetical protein